MLTIDRAQARADLVTLSASGLVAPSYDLEHTLHEACHATLLGIRAPFPAALDRVISSSVGLMHSHLVRDWHEIQVCATELRIAHLIDLDLEEPLHPAWVLGGNVEQMDPVDATSHIEETVWTEATYRRARSTIDAIQVTAKALRGEHG